MRSFKLFALLLFCAAQAFAQPSLEIPSESRQLIVVTSKAWDDSTATMYRFERENTQSEWLLKGAAIPVNLGRTGLAWGRSSLMDKNVGKLSEGRQKREGDGRSPAGIFPLTKAFGHPQAPEGYGEENLPFVILTNQQCVDDSTSPYYNQIVKPNEVGGVTWNSAETMKIELYRLGIVVGHNCPKASPGLGSCIFFHLEGAKGSATAGCTSMSEAALKETMLWLKSEQKPVVIQLPEKEYSKLKGDFPQVTLK